MKSTRARATSSCSAPYSWPACAASNPGRSASSSTPSWSSIRRTWPACAPRTRNAGCPCSGLSITSSPRKWPIRSKATGAWTRSRRASCHRRTGPGSASSKRWTIGTRRAPTAPSQPWHARLAPSRCMSCSGATAAAISATSATRRYAANSWRTLQAIGWRHGEPVVRSLAYAMLDRGGNDNPAEHDYDADRPYRENQKRVADIGPLWKQRRRVSPEAAADLLETLRTASPSDASTKVVELLKKGIHPSSIWDGLLLTAGELIMRQPGIVGIHCITSANALHFGYQTTASDETRRLLMLQTAAFLSMFRQAMGSQGKLAGV